MVVLELALSGMQRCAEILVASSFGSSGIRWHRAKREFARSSRCPLPLTASGQFTVYTSASILLTAHTVAEHDFRVFKDLGAGQRAEILRGLAAKVSQGLLCSSDELSRSPIDRSWALRWADIFYWVEHVCNVFYHIDYPWQARLTVEAGHVH